MRAAMHGQRTEWITGNTVTRNGPTVTGWSGSTMTRSAIGCFASSPCVTAEAWTGTEVPSSRPQPWSGWAWDTKTASGRMRRSIPLRFCPKSHSSRNPSASSTKAEWPA